MPFIRPAKLASDTTPTLPVLQHAVNYVEKNDKFKPDLILLIQPTNPLIKPDDIDGVIETLFKTATNSCFTVTEISQRPEWMYKIGGKTAELFFEEKFGPQKRSQELPRLAIINGTAYLMKYDTLMKKNKIRDDNTSIYLMPRERSADIDDAFDFELAKFLMKRNKLR